MPENREALPRQFVAQHHPQCNDRCHDGEHWIEGTKVQERVSHSEEFLRLFDELIAFAETHVFRGRRRALWALRQVRRQGTLRR